MQCEVRVLLTILIALLAVLTPTEVLAKNEISLAGQHRFRVGDDAAWLEPDYDDSDWDLIQVPQDWDTADIDQAAWIGWYRIRFRCESFAEKDQPAVLLGPISDADEVWLNGHRHWRCRYDCRSI